MLRIALFLATNIAIMVLVTIIFKVLGLEQYLAAQGVHGDLTSLLVFSAIFGFAGSFISLLLSKFMAKASTGTRVITEPGDARERWLLDTVAQLARKADIAMPEVGVFPMTQANAFATGWNKNAALVAVSEGLLHRFDQEEIRAVLAHEIGHVANGDMVTLTLVQGVLNTFVIFFARIIGSIIDKAVFRNERGNGIGYFMIVMVLQLVLGVLASMVVMAFSRWREFRADAAGATLASRGAMIAALQRLRAESEAETPDQLPDSMTAFGIAGGKGGIARLFMSHPPLEERIERLRRGV